MMPLLRARSFQKFYDCGGHRPDSAGGLPDNKPVHAYKTHTASEHISMLISGAWDVQFTFCSVILETISNATSPATTNEFSSRNANTIDCGTAA
jgi:hypothetical protein